MNDVEIDDGEKKNENREEIRIRKAKDIETMFYYTYPNKRIYHVLNTYTLTSDKFSTFAHLKLHKSFTRVWNHFEFIQIHFKAENVELSIRPEVEEGLKWRDESNYLYFGRSKDLDTFFSVDKEGREMVVVGSRVAQITSLTKR